MLLLKTYISFLLTSAAFGSTNIQVRRSLTSVDKITFTDTNDKSVCNTYGAVYNSSSTYYNNIVCQCTNSKPSFYSVDADQKPSCYPSNAKNLGCTRCQGDCVSSISTKATPISWIAGIDTFKCFSDGAYTIKFWNGQSWKKFARSSDFSVSYGTEYEGFQLKSTAKMTWDHSSIYTAYSDYKGHLFLITLYCSKKKLSCFLAEAAGSQSYSLLGDEEQSESKKTAVWVGVGSALFLLLLIVIICCLVWKKKAKKKSGGQQHTNPDATAPPYVISNNNVQQQQQPTCNMVPHSQPSRTLDHQIIQQSAPLRQSHVRQVQHQPVQPRLVAHQPLMTQQQIIHNPPAQVTQWHQMPMQSSVQIIPQTSQVMYAAPNHNLIVHPVAAPMSYGPQVVFPGKKGKTNTMRQVANGIKMTNNVLNLAGGVSDLFG